MITRKNLQREVDIINAKTGRKFYLNHQAAYGGYFLSEDNPDTSRYDTTGLRLSASEMYAHLGGIIFGLSMRL
jgi:hypothetical protein